jgi:hypothetical protein
MPRRRLYLSSRCNGPVVEPTFRGGAKRFRNHPYALVASAGTLPPISRESQPHDARHLPVARCITNSALNAVRTSACWELFSSYSSWCSHALPCHSRFETSHAHSTNLVPMHPTARRRVRSSSSPSSRCRHKPKAMT